MNMCELLIMKLFLSRSIQIKWIFSYQIMYKLWREKTPKTPWYEIVWHLVWNGSQNKNQVLREPNKLIKKKNTSISWNRWTLGLKCLAPHVNWISKRYQVHLEPNKLSPNTKHETLKDNSNNSTQTPHGYFETEKGWDVWIVWHLMWTGSYSIKYQIHLEPHKLIPSNTNQQHLGAENNENVWSLLWAKFSENTSSTMNQTILIYRK